MATNNLSAPLTMQGDILRNQQEIDRLREDFGELVDVVTYLTEALKEITDMLNEKNKLHG